MMQKVDAKTELTLSGPILQDLQATITTATIDDDLSEPKHTGPDCALRQHASPFFEPESGTRTGC